MKKQKQWYHGIVMYGLALITVIAACVVQGCGLEETDTKKLKDLSYERSEERRVGKEC